MGAATVIVAPAFGTTAFRHGQQRFAVDLSQQLRSAAALE